MHTVDLNLEAPHVHCTICRTNHHPNWHQPEWRNAAWEALDAARSAADTRRAALIRAAIHHNRVQTR